MAYEVEVSGLEEVDGRKEQGTNHLRQSDEVLDRVSVVPMVFKVLMHAGILDGDVEGEEVLDDEVALGGDIGRRAVAEEEVEHWDAEGLGGHMERREAVAVAGVGVGAAVGQRNTALERHLGAAHGVLGDDGNEDIWENEIAAAHKVRPAAAEVLELGDPVLGQYGLQYWGHMNHVLGESLLQQSASRSQPKIDPLISHQHKKSTHLILCLEMGSCIRIPEAPTIRR